MGNLINENITQIVFRITIFLIDISTLTDIEESNLESELTLHSFFMQKYTFRFA